MDKSYLVDDKYSIKDLVDLEKLRIIFEKFTQVTGFTVGFLDHPGLNVLIATGWKDICTKFHRSCPASFENCRKSNSHLLDQLNTPGQLVIESCDNGLVDCATPIIVNGKHIASLATGQLLLKEPDIEFFKKQAKAFGFDEREYLEALKEIPVVSEEKLKFVTSLLGEIATMISDMGHLNLISKEEAAQLQNEISERIKTEEELKNTEFSYHTIFEAVNDAIFVNAIDTGAILDLNNRACEMFCYSREEMMSLAVNDISAGYPPYSQKEILEFMKKADEGEPQMFEWLCKDKAERLFWTEINLKRAVVGGKYILLAIVRDISERKEAIHKLNRINDVFLNFGSDPLENINRLTALCGELLKADCALYNRVEAGMMTSCGQWNVPQGFKSVDKPEGQICYDVIKGGVGQVVVIQDLQNTGYAVTDPNVSQYKLKTYLGCPVQFGGEYGGSLCVVYQHDFTPTEDDKNVVGIIASAIGVEEERRSSEEVSRLSHFAMDRASDPVFWVDNESRILYANESASALFGYSVEELKAMTVGDIAPDFKQPRWMVSWERAKNNPSLKVEAVSRNKDGKLFPVEVTINYIKYDGDEYICAFVRNITERKLAEAKLLEEDKFLTNIFSSIQDGLSVLDKDMNILRVNSTMEKWYGHEMPLIGKKCYEAYHKRSERCKICPTERAIQSGQTAYEIVPRIGMHGETIGWLDLYSFPMLDSATGELKGVIEYVRDITEKKNAEESIVKRDYQLEILSRTSQHINVVLEVSVILRTVVAAAMELVDATVGGGGLLSGDKIEFKEFNNMGKVEHVNYAFTVGEGAPGWNSGSIKPYLSNDPGHLKTIARPINEIADIYNIIIVPIISAKGVLLGCFEIANKSDRAPFDSQDVFMLQGLAAAASVSLENARMLESEKNSSLALRHERDLANSYLNVAGVIIVAIGKDKKVTLINNKGCEILGYSREEIIGKDWFENFVPKRIREEIAEAFCKILSGKSKFGEYVENPVLVKGGGERMIAWRNTLLRDADGKIIATLSSGGDITDKKKAEEARIYLNKELEKSNRRLKQLALKDFETGLYNHHYLSEVIESEYYRAKRYANPLSIIMLDIDYFKSINDAYGHGFGDVVLKQLAKRLKSMVRKYDTVVRFGGEEFVIVSSVSDRSKAVMQANRILEAINLNSFGDSKHEVKLKLSIGVASYIEDNAISGRDLINIAEKILTKAKEEGGNRVYSSLDVKEAAKKGYKYSDMANVKFLKDKIGELTKKGNQNLIESIFAFAKTLELRDHYTGKHTENTVHYSTEIAKELNLSDKDIDSIRKASILHDLGKVGISDKVLHKKTKLTKKEFDEIKRHPQIAADIIRPVHLLRDIVPFVLYHHERWDGKGYPSGLIGPEIPMGARIISVADVYQALTSNRPYRKAFSHEAAIGIIKEGYGSQFDPKVVDAFFKILKKEKKGKKK